MIQLAKILSYDPKRCVMRLYIDWSQQLRGNSEMGTTIKFEQGHNKKYWAFNHLSWISQLGECQTEDLKVACSIHAHRII